MPNLRKFYKDTIRVEQQYRQYGGKWRLYKHDGERFQIIDEFDEEDEAVVAAKALGD